MKKVPVIGITTSRVLDPNPMLPGYPRAILSTDYIEALSRLGAMPVMIPPILTEEQLAWYLDTCDGLLISGGKDISPMHYGEMTHPRCGDSDYEVDTCHLALARGMIGREKPVLGICRGSQIINVAMGGSMYQDVASQKPGAGGHVVGTNLMRWAPCHQAHLTEGGLLESIFGKSEMKINSLHHQAIARLGEGLALDAAAPDGVVEAVTLPGRPVLGVQWHPEMMLQHDDEMLPIFRWFVEACGE